MYDIDTQHVTSLLNYKPGYLDKDNELIVGLQTDRPLRRGVNPFCGLNMTRKACQAYGYELSEKVEPRRLRMVAGKPHPSSPQLGHACAR